MLSSPASTINDLDSRERVLSWLGGSHIVNVLATFTLYNILGLLFESVVAPTMRLARFTSIRGLTAGSKYSSWRSLGWFYPPTQGA